MQPCKAQINSHNIYVHPYFSTYTPVHQFCSIFGLYLYRLYTGGCFWEWNFIILSIHLYHTYIYICINSCQATIFTEINKMQKTLSSFIFHLYYHFILLSKIIKIELTFALLAGTMSKGVQQVNFIGNSIKLHFPISSFSTHSYS